MTKPTFDMEAALQAASDLVASQTVTIKVMDVDRYGRAVGRVFVDGVNVNRALVEYGHCWVYTRYAKDKQLFTLQDKAKNSQRGLWRLPESERVAPWEWRRSKRKTH
jgi:micrococcal nuclease